MFGILKGNMNCLAGLLGLLVLCVALLVMPSCVMAGSVALVNGDHINVREGPGTGYGIIGELNKGESVAVLDKSSDWYKVKLSNGNGWVAGSFLQVSDQNSDTSSASWLLDSASSAGNQVQQVKTGVPTQKPVPAMPEWLRPREGKSVSSNTSNTEKDKPDEKPFVWNGGTLTKIDVRNNNDSVVVTVYATGKLQVNAFTMNNPDRLILDLTGVIPGEIPSTINVSSDIVKQVRAAWFSKDPVKSRVVMDLIKPSGYRTTLSNDQKTLVVELYKKAKATDGKKLIVIDPGHGGSDPGAIGDSGLFEKDITLDIAKQVASLLKKNGYNVGLTRTSDTYVGLDERTDYANALGADLFVSVHINSSTGQTASGTSTHYRSDEGKFLSTYIQSTLLSGLGRQNRGIQYNNFAVLRTSNMTSALAELAFISNPEEEALLKTADFRTKAAEAIVQGINNYYRDMY